MIHARRVSWLLSLAVVSSLSAQQVFRGGIAVVEVAVSVRDGRRQVSGLLVGDFSLRDNGALQRLDSVSAEPVPLAVTLVLDLSRSVEGPVLNRLTAAVNEIATQLPAGDKFRLLTVQHAVQQVVAWRNGPTVVGPSELAVARGTTVLYDGLSDALVTAVGAIPRHVVIVFTDGRDTASVVTPSHLTAVARVSDAVAFAVVPVAQRIGEDLRTLPSQEQNRILRARNGAFDGDAALREVTTVTGGELFVVDIAGPLGDTFARAVEQVRASYVLRYSPSEKAKPGWHELDVRVTKGRYQVRSRRGYLVASGGKHP
jgi:VWFA-related protein